MGKTQTQSQTPRLEIAKINFKSVRRTIQNAIKYNLVKVEPKEELSKIYKFLADFKEYQ